MTLNDQKEAFSKTYARAIASVAGFVCIEQEYDRDSIDISFKSTINPFVIIEAQLKSTSRVDAVVSNEIRFPLPVKNYNDLRGDAILPRILVILILPDKMENQENEQPEQWIHQTQEQLALMKCAYWINLKDMPATTNQATVTITIPMDEGHIFKPSVLSYLADLVISQREKTKNG